MCICKKGVFPFIIYPQIDPLEFLYFIRFQKLEPKNNRLSQMDINSNKSYSLHSKTSQRNSCSSFSSFADDTPKKKKKIDRMIYSIDKTDYQWFEKRLKIKSVLNQRSLSKSPSKKFEDYLSDHMSDDTESLKEFLVRSRFRNKRETERKRNVPQMPFKETKFKHWRDNFYTNLLDWNHDNIIFAAAQRQVTQYNLSSFDTQQPKVHNQLWIKGSKINSIKCSPTSTNLAIAYDSGSLRIYNYHSEKTVNLDILHSSRITALDWCERSILTGSKDKTIKMMDQRTYKQSVYFKQVHKQQVLGIKRCGDLIATGGNDNLVAIYDIRKTQKLINSYEHYAAVKSLAWIQSEKTLLSGGGTSDKVIKFWNYKQNQVVKQIQTGSQICNLMVSKNTKEFVSCQGFSQNQIVLWDFSGKRLQILHGKHSARVLYSALSPCGQYLATGAGDTNLLVWKMFPSSTRKNRLFQNFDLR